MESSPERGSVGKESGVMSQPASPTLTQPASPELGRSPTCTIDLTHSPRRKEAKEPTQTPELWKEEVAPTGVAQVSTSGSSGVSAVEHT